MASATAFAVPLLIIAVQVISTSGYLVGLGKADITGPAADVELMGYANPLQTAQGIHTRLYARAFIFVDDGDEQRRFVYVNIDACMASQLVTLEVISRLQAEYGGLYGPANVAISGTHTHASPAGFLQHALYSITSLGFVQQTFAAMVEGVVEAVRRAHSSVRPARVWLNSGDLRNASINRSPSAYAANPLQERQKYADSVDTLMTLLRVDDAASGAGLGALTWFAVHCTSMNNTNRLVSGDNKGRAEQLMEAWARSGQPQQARQAGPTAPASGGGAEAPLAKPAPASAAGVATGAARAAAAAVGAVYDGFVAAFAQGSVGDTSPNVLGAFCLDTGLPCDVVTSTCNNRSQLCHGRGPAWPDDAMSTHIIGERQYKKARGLFEGAQEELAGPVDYRHAYLPMANLTVAASRWTRGGRTCAPAMGMSFAAGTTDGPGAFDFVQSDTRGPPLWRLISRWLMPPSPALRDCQAPKPVLLATGETQWPYAWQPAVTEVSLLRLGRLLIACLPGEPSTMAGRRIKEALREVVAPAWGDVHVAISGLTNTYSSYITTWEEYQQQRYEGASTIFGPHTLDAYIQELIRLARDMMAGRPSASGPPPPNLHSQQISLLPGVAFDAVPPGSSFGEVVQQAHGPVRPGDTVEVTFRAACPRNNLRLGGTFLTIERAVATNGHSHHNASALTGARAGSGGASGRRSQRRLRAAWRIDAGPGPGPAAGVESGREDASMPLHGAEAEPVWWAVHTDDDWCTKFHWHRPHSLSPLSFATITWHVPHGTVPGLYRVHYFGDAKSLLGHVHAFEGASLPFEVLPR